MVGFDVPEVTNDMITRFMGVDLSLVPGVLGQTSGKLGGINKVALSAGSAAAGIPLLKGGKSDIESKSSSRGTREYEADIQTGTTLRLHSSSCSSSFPSWRSTSTSKDGAAFDGE